MTDEQKSVLRAEIISWNEMAANLAGIIDPKLIPALLIERALAKVGATLVPNLVDDVEKFISKAEPLPDEIDHLHAGIVELADSNLL